MFTLVIKQGYACGNFEKETSSGFLVKTAKVFESFVQTLAPTSLFLFSWFFRRKTCQNWFWRFMALWITWPLGRNASRLQIISKMYKTSWFPLKDCFWTKYTSKVEGGTRHCATSEPPFGFSSSRPSEGVQKPGLGRDRALCGCLWIELQGERPNGVLQSVLLTHLLLRAIIYGP